MSDMDVLYQLLLAGTTSTNPDSGTPPTASFDSGTVANLIDTTHILVDLGDKQVTVYVPATLAGAVTLGSGVRVQSQENSYVLDSVLTQPAAGPVPVGTVVMWITATIPSGWLLLDGSSYNTTTYPQLFAVLGTSSLPDMRDRFPIGKSGTKGLLTTGGASTKTLSISEMPSHNHNISVDNTTLLYPSTGNVANIIYPVVNGAVTTFTGGGQSFSILNPYLAVNYIIKAA